MLTMLNNNNFNIRHIRTSASIRFEAASIPFALHKTFTRSGSKMDRFDTHIYGR